MIRITEFLRRNEWLLLVLFVLAFVLIRLPATGFPLHQDEYKWPKIVNPALSSDTEIPHPPLSQFIYRTAGEIVGFNVNFRYVPLFFGTLNLLLLYFFLRNFFGKREAAIGGLIWIFSYFSVLASVMVDTDGQIMPFFFLLSIISYFKFKKSFGRKKWLWLATLFLSLILGFFIKVSFLLSLAAIALDFVLDKRDKLNVKQIGLYTSCAIGGGLILVGFLYVSQIIFPFFDLSTSVTYWEHFWTISRDWFQTFIQVVKAVLYSSPLLLILFFTSRDELKKTKLFFIYIACAVFFYVFLFDFSLGALDRYFQFLILPITVISSVVLASATRANERRFKEFFLLGLVLALFIVLLQSLPHYVPPLHPKTEWLSRVLSLRWNFVYPFSGGSGPLGFYMSFLFMALVWISAVVGTAFFFWKRQWRPRIIAFLLPLFVVYNFVFIEEYEFGFGYGSAPRLLSESVEYIKNDSNIEKVTVYNDNGGDEIQAIGKYRKRLYVDPKFDLDEKIATLNTYKEHYFVLGIPRLNPDTVYQKYFDSCVVVYNKVDKKISATVYDCRGVPDINIIE